MGAATDAPAFADVIDGMHRDLAGGVSVASWDGGTYELWRQLVIDGETP